MSWIDALHGLTGGGFSGLGLNLFQLGAGAWDTWLKDQRATQQYQALHRAETGLWGSGLDYLGEDAGIAQYYFPSTELIGQNYGAMRDQLLGDQRMNQQDFRRLELNTMGAQQDRANSLLGGFDTMSRQQQDAFQGSYGGLLGQYDQAFAPITQGYQDRFSRNMAYLEGSGEQEKKDIDAAFRAQQSSVAQDLQARGLGNTTVRQSMQSGVESARVNEQGRLAERLRQQRLATDAALSGDLLNAQAQVAGNRMNLATGLADRGFGLLDSIARGRMGLTDQLSAEKSDMLSKLWTDQFNLNQGNRAQLTDLLGRTMAADYNARAVGAANIANSYANTQIAYPQSIDPLAFALGQGWGEAQRLESLKSPGGMASWLNPGTGALAGTGLAGAGGLISSLALAPMTPLGWGLTLGAGAAGGTLFGMLGGR